MKPCSVSSLPSATAAWLIQYLAEYCVNGNVSLLTRTVISVTEVNLARVARALEGEVKGGSSLEGAGKGRLWRKGSRKGVDEGAQCVDALLSHLSCL